MYVKSAFLQEKEINKDKCLRPSKEVQTLKFGKLTITEYGLCDSHGDGTFKEILLKTGAAMRKFDNYVFYWHKSDQKLICCHVNDFIWPKSKAIAVKFI